VNQKIEASKFPLRLMSSVRSEAEARSANEGVSLNQFINLAVAEKLDRMRQVEWDLSRKKPTEESRRRALAILHRGGTLAPEPWDQLPEGYVSASPRPRLEKATAAAKPERRGKKVAAK
jgi:hypothetical protein